MSETKVMERVQFMHFRCWKDGSPEDSEMLSKGGMTVCYYPIKDSDLAIMTASVCSPKDNFNKKRGRIGSHGRCQGFLIKKYVGQTEKDIEDQDMNVHGFFVKKLDMRSFSDISRDFADSVWSYLSNAVWRCPEKTIAPKPNKHFAE
jgi:hypothetical protein